jgi:hypothetical protein
MRTGKALLDELQRSFPKANGFTDMLASESPPAAGGDSPTRTSAVSHTATANSGVVAAHLLQLHAPAAGGNVVLHAQAAL